MSSAGRSARLFARLNPTSTDAQGRAFVQSRLCLFLKTLFFTSTTYLIFANVMYWLFPEQRPERVALINYIAIAGIANLPWTIWVTSPGRLRSARFLLGLDVAAVVVTCAIFGAAAVLAQDQEINVYGALLWMGYTALARSLVVPSTARQTAVLSFVGLAPALGVAAVVDVEIPTVPMFIGVLIALVVVVTLSSIGSHVIYGLRTQVKEAMQLGQYTILDKIGEGGMGTVYRARHAMLRRPTAVKLLKPQRIAIGDLARFEREVQATSELTHPNTVAVYDFGRSPDGLFYYAMEYLDGVDVNTLVAATGPQPWQRVVHILRQICGALEEAHSAELIHRDIKPGNIILCTRGGIRDFAKVVDFGLVKDLAAATGESTGSLIAGTPAYISPEAVTHPDRVGPASDLYALGAVGYYLLTGRLVFGGATTVEMCMHHVDTEPTPPSLCTDNTVPPALDALILKCLAKAPGDRPGSAYEIKTALAELAEIDPWTEEQATAWWEEHGASIQSSRTAPAPSSIVTMTVDLSSRTAQRIVSGVAE